MLLPQIVERARAIRIITEPSVSWKPSVNEIRGIFEGCHDTIWKREFESPASPSPWHRFVQIRNRPAQNLEDIDWEDFEVALEKKGLVVYKAENSDFLRMMKDR